MSFRVWGVGFRVGFRVKGLGCRFLGLGVKSFRIFGLRFSGT